MTLFLDFSLIAGILITLLILFFLFNKEEKGSGQKMLTAIFVLIFLVFTCYYAYLHQIIWLLVPTFIFEDAADVFLGPMLFVYIKCIAGDTDQTSISNRNYFIYPIISVLLISIPSLVLELNGNFQGSIFNKLEPLISFEILYSFWFLLQAFFRLKAFQKTVKNNYSNLEYKDLSWAKKFLLGLMGVILIDVGTTVHELFIAEELKWNIGYLTIVPAIFFVMYLGYYGISQTTVLLPDFLSNNLKDFKGFPNGKTLKKSVRYEYDDEEMKKLQLSLELLMDREHPYLKDDLSLGQLAKMLDSSDKRSLLC